PLEEVEGAWVDIRSGGAGALERALETGAVGRGPVLVPHVRAVDVQPRRDLLDGPAQRRARQVTAVAVAARDRRQRAPEVAQVRLEQAEHDRALLRVDQ